MAGPLPNSFLCRSICHRRLRSLRVLIDMRCGDETGEYLPATHSPLASYSSHRHLLRKIYPGIWDSCVCPCQGYQSRGLRKGCVRSSLQFCSGHFQSVFSADYQNPLLTVFQCRDFSCREDLDLLYSPFPFLFLLRLPWMYPLYELHQFWHPKDGVSSLVWGVIMKLPFLSLISCGPECFHHCALEMATTDCLIRPSCEFSWPSPACRQQIYLISWSP
mmetsp:Transcript_21039/g.49685  ORF Transcript_21039/g.49685 Transcript_21039/m.49685 type:complete len:218 (+) Transcript_21039:323-976(+)